MRVSSDGIFDGDQKVAELPAMVQQTPRGAVRGIWEPAHSHLIRNIVIVGAIAAIGVVVFIVVRNAILDAIEN